MIIYHLNAHLIFLIYLLSTKYSFSLFNYNRFLSLLKIAKWKRIARTKKKEEKEKKKVVVMFLYTITYLHIYKYTIFTHYNRYKIHIYMSLYFEGIILKTEINSLNTVNTILNAKHLFLHFCILFIIYIIILSFSIFNAFHRKYQWYIEIRQTILFDAISYF